MLANEKGRRWVTGVIQGSQVDRPDHPAIHLDHSERSLPKRYRRILNTIRRRTTTSLLATMTRRKRVTMTTRTMMMKTRMRTRKTMVPPRRRQSE